MNDLGYCDDLRAVTNTDARCCDSCHEDVDYGFYLCEIAFDGRTYSLCCALFDVAAT